MTWWKRDCDWRQGRRNLTKIGRNDDLMKKGLRHDFWRLSFVVVLVGMMTWWKRDCDTNYSVLADYDVVGMMTWWKRDCDLRLPSLLYSYPFCRNDDLMKKGLRLDCLNGLEVISWRRNDDLMKKGLRRDFRDIITRGNDVGMMTWWKRDCDPAWGHRVIFRLPVGMMTWRKRDCDSETPKNTLLDFQ